MTNSSCTVIKKGRAHNGFINCRWFVIFFPKFKFDPNFDPQKIGSYEHNGNSEFPL